LLAIVGTVGTATADQDVTDFAQARCVVPLLQGGEIDTGGLQETTADALGLTPEPNPNGTEPQYFQDGEDGAVLGTLTVFSMRGCITLLPAEEAGTLPLTSFEAMASANEMVIPEDCRTRMVEDDKGPEEVTWAFSQGRNPDGRFVTLAHVTHMDGRRPHVMAWETTDRSNPISCRGDS
jgi:hypothetical protein